MNHVQVIDGAIEAGVLNPVDFSIDALNWEPPGIAPNILKIAELIEPSPCLPIQARAQGDNPAHDTRAQRYQDQGFTWDLSHGATDGMVYELARFEADTGECGFVKYIGTWVQIVDGGGQPIELDFSNPFTMQDNGVQAEFLLRYSGGDSSIIGTAPWQGTPETVPGLGYPTLPFWNDYRFYWGRYANHVWFLVPRFSFLRLYIHVISGGSELRGALGRLQGYTQPIRTIGAEYNVSHGW